MGKASTSTAPHARDTRSDRQAASNGHTRESNVRGDGIVEDRLVLLGLLALAVVIGLMITIIAIFGGGLEATRG